MRLIFSINHLQREFCKRLFSQGQGVEIRLHPEGDQAHGGLFQNQKGGKGGRGKKKAGAEDPAGESGNLKRHDLFRVSE